MDNRIKNKKFFWLSLCLANLVIVAALGFILRSKILFSIPFIDYRNVLSAHSHFAFGGWVGLSLMTLLIYEILPSHFSQQRIYQWILAGIEISSLGMAFTFPFLGYSILSIVFSSAYILISFAFAGIFIRQVLKADLNKNVKLLSLCGIGSLVLSAIGPLGLAFILATKSGNSLLYRDSIYTFLHFQYNGFFTLSIFTLILNQLVKKGIVLNGKARLFSISLCLSIVPTLFLSLLWHNQPSYYWIAAIGCIFILIAIAYFFSFALNLDSNKLFIYPLAKNLFILSLASFALKMILHIGTIFPALGNAVYGDRPVIIGFLHLVFLGFVTFYILSNLIESNYFNGKNEKLIKLPFYIFGFGIISNEIILMLQGLGILFETNSFIFNWLLWGAGIILLHGALQIYLMRKLNPSRSSSDITLK